MKDIIIKGSAIKRELYILLGCFIASYMLNIYAVIHFSRPAAELYNTIGYVFAFMLIIYAALWIVRLIALLVRHFIRK